MKFITSKREVDTTDLKNRGLAKFSKVTQSVTAKAEAVSQRAHEVADARAEARLQRRSPWNAVDGDLPEDYLS